MNDWSAGLWHRLGRQLAAPSGRGGRLVGHLMVPLNRDPNRRAIDALAPVAGESYLEVGFGPGAGLAEIGRRAPQCRLSGIDRSPAMLDLAWRRCRQATAGRPPDLRIGSAESLSWPDASFDGVLAVNVAYFFDGAGRAVEEIRRVLKPGGRLVVYVTDRATMRHWPFAGQSTHRTFDEGELRAMLVNGGFHPEDQALTVVRLPFGFVGWIAVAKRPAVAAAALSA